MATKTCGSGDNQRSYSTGREPSTGGGSLESGLEGKEKAFGEQRFSNYTGTRSELPADHEYLNDPYMVGIR